MKSIHTNNIKNKKSFNIIANANNAPKSLIKKLKLILERNNFCFNPTTHEYLFIVGGDGTLVKALKKYYESNTKIIVINTGTVGFYSILDKKINNENIKQILNIKNYIKPNLLEININDNKIYNSLNELVIQGINTIRADVYINDKIYEQFMGTGLLVSTRTGSTAQSKSNGGAIIMPNINAYEFLEIAPTLHAKNTTIKSPLIIDHQSRLTFNNFKSNQRCDLIIDGMRVTSIKENDVVKVKLNKSKFYLFWLDSDEKYIDKLKKTFLNT